MRIGTALFLLLPFVGAYWWALKGPRRCVVAATLKISALICMILAVAGFLGYEIHRTGDISLWCFIPLFLSVPIFVYVTVPCVLALPVRAKWDDQAISIPN